MILSYNSAVFFRTGFADLLSLNLARVVNEYCGLEALDISVLGRDITESFAVIVDQPGDVVSLLAQMHRYSIVQA